MAIILYANGLTEEYKSKENIFSDNELLKIFSMYDKTRTFRLYEVPNTWCIWGEYKPINKKEDEFNRLGSDILDQSCYSPILFIHDTELDPTWKLTDEMIFNGYDKFKEDLNRLLDEVALDILTEKEKERLSNGDQNKLIVLDQLEVSEDKRIIFKFNPDKQSDEFYLEKNLDEFAIKIYNFLSKNYKDGDIFSLYADKHIIIVMEDDQVKQFIDKLIDHFNIGEKYEYSSLITNTYKKWKSYKDKKNKSVIKKQPKKRGPKPKKKENKNPEDEG